MVRKRMTHQENRSGSPAAMVDEPEKQISQMADKIVELIKLASVARARSRSGRPEELTEAEFLTLDALSEGAELTVGAIQKRIGVLPAQMSRVIRTLESKGGDAYVSCSINASDRRKIDVRMTAKGERSLRAYRAVRRRFALGILESLNETERDQFMSILGRISQIISQARLADT